MPTTPKGYLFASQLTQPPRGAPALIPSGTYRKVGVVRARPFTIRAEKTEFGELMVLHQRWVHNTSSQLDVLIAMGDNCITGFAHPLRDSDPEAAMLASNVSSLASHLQSALKGRRVTVERDRDDLGHSVPVFPRVVWPFIVRDEDNFASDTGDPIKKLQIFSGHWQYEHSVTYIEGLLQKFVLSLGKIDERIGQDADTPALSLSFKIPSNSEVIIPYAAAIAGLFEAPYFYFLTGARVELYERVQ